MIDCKTMILKHQLKSVRWVVAITTLMFLTACQTPMQAGSQCVLEPGSLNDARTFTWFGEEAIDVVDTTGYISPIVEKYLAQSVVAEMNSKGISFSEDPNGLDPTNDDLSVAITLRTRRELVSFETAPNPCQDVDCWERIDPGAATRMDIRTIGFLAADIYYRGEAVWRGWVETSLFPKDRDNAEEVIAKAIPKLFESFPP
jgi:hypothetical protein